MLCASLCLTVRCPTRDAPLQQQPQQRPRALRLRQLLAWSECPLSTPLPLLVRRPRWCMSRSLFTSAHLLLRCSDTIHATAQRPSELRFWYEPLGCVCVASA